MAHLDVAQLLDSLRQHGTIDSQGQFTISLAEARRKLIEFRSSNRRRYILLMVSSGIGAGATEVSITPRPESGGYRLSMPGAYLPESQLLGTFVSSLSDSESATDLVLGLQAAFAEGAATVQVRLTHPCESSYQWSLRADSESSQPAPRAEAAIEIEIAFPPRSLGERVRGFFGLRGYIAQPEELRLLEQLCTASRVPIRVGSEMVNRPVFFSKHSVLCRVGKLEVEVAGGCLPWPQPARSWAGLLAVGPGPITLVVRGVAVGQIDDCGVHGLICHDGLGLDLTREQLLQDWRYDSLLQEIDEVRLDLLAESLAKISTLSREGRAAVLSPAIAALLREQLPAEAGENMLACAIPSVGQRLPSIMATFRDRLLYFLRQEETRREFPELPPLHRTLLDLCAWALRLRRHDVPELFQVTLRELEQSEPGETLMPGYLLLGLGAYFSDHGQESVAQNYWMQALDVVRAGRDSRAEDLIHAHMDFSVQHIMDQTANAVSMFLSTTEQDGQPDQARGSKMNMSL